MTRTFWPLSAVVFASLLACNDDSGGQKASASDASTTGPGDAPATATATATASVPTTSGDSVSDGLTTAETTINATLGTMTSTTSDAVSASETLSDSGNSGITATAASETRGSDTISSDTNNSDTNNSDTNNSDTISSDTNNSDTTSSDTNNCGDTDGDPNGDTNGGDGGGNVITCEGKVWACGDGKDNDGDGKIDNADVECISPCDDDEGSFQTDLPGQAEDCKNDCYWDLDSGAGQDKCEYDLKCDAKSPGALIGCGYVEPGCGPEQVPQPQQCMDTCQPLAPNGCDCFGCCHIGGSKETYYLDASDDCSATNLKACKTCTFQEDCSNPCVGCEICFGQTEPPEGCDPGEGEQCGAGEKACTMGGCNDCPDNQFCQTGCCKPIPL